MPASLIYKNSRRILLKFDLIEATRLDDLTNSFTERNNRGFMWKLTIEKMT